MATSMQVVDNSQYFLNREAALKKTARPVLTQDIPLSPFLELCGILASTTNKRNYNAQEERAI